MKNKLKNIAVLFFLVIILILPYLVFAQENIGPLKRLENVATGKGAYTAADEYTISKIAGIAVRAFLGLLGVIFIVLIIYAGYHWMLARGDEEKVNKAKDTLTRAVIGLIIIIGSYAIWSYVWDSLFAD